MWLGSVKGPDSTVGAILNPGGGGTNPGSLSHSTALPRQHSKDTSKEAGK
jgi:hypothetical protein